MTDHDVFEEQEAEQDAIEEGERATEMRTEQRQDAIARVFATKDGRELAALLLLHTGHGGTPIGDIDCGRHSVGTWVRGLLDAIGPEVYPLVLSEEAQRDAYFADKAKVR